MPKLKLIFVNECRTLLALWWLKCSMNSSKGHKFNRQFQGVDPLVAKLHKYSGLETAVE